MLYGLVTTHYNDAVSFHYSLEELSFSELQNHIGLVFITTGIISITFSFYRKNFRNYMIVYSAMAFALMLRLAGIFSGNVGSTDEAAILVWAQVFILQFRVLVEKRPTIPSRSKSVKKTAHYQNSSAPHYSKIKGAKHYGRD